MKREIKRIGIFSAVKTGFLLGLIGGILVGLFNAVVIMSIASGLAEAGMDPSYYAEEFADVLNVGFGMLAFLSPVFGGMIGVITGVVCGFVGAAVYNVGARLWGGVEIDLNEIETRSVVPKELPKSSSMEATPLPTHKPPPPAPPRPPEIGDMPPRGDVE